MDVSQLGKTSVPATTGGRLSQLGPRNQQCALDLPQGGGLIEELGEPLCQDTDPAVEGRNQGKEQLLPGQVIAQTGIHMSGSRLGWTSS